MAASGAEEIELKLRGSTWQPKDLWRIPEGDPTKNLKKFMHLFEIFADLCNKHNIKYWLEWGTSIGYMRHRSIIPWDYDIDLAMTSDQFKKLVPIVEQWNVDNVETGVVFGWYKDWDIGHYQESYEEPAYCMYYKNERHILMDICEYNVEGTELVVPQKTWKYPNLKHEHAFPLKMVSMLGHRTWTQAVPEIPLDNMYGNWKSYDVVAWVLAKLYHPKTLERMCTAPVLEVPEAKSISEGLEHYGNKGKPFLIRWLPKLSPGLDVAKELAAHGVKHSTDHSHKLSAEFQLSASEAGGNWVVAHGGAKSLHLIDSKHHHVLHDESTKQLRNLPIRELLFLNDIELWGNIHHAWLDEGDFVYFPPAFIHRATAYPTTENSSGVADKRGN